MIDSITFHQVKTRDFIRLLPCLSQCKEWFSNSRKKYYMSGTIIINKTEINLFTEDYNKKLNLTKNFNKC